MSPIIIGVIGIGVLFLLLFSRMPIGFAMALVGFVGVCYSISLEAGMGVIETIPFRTVFSYTLCVLPLFILMGQFSLYSRISGDLYDTMHKWLGHLPGGLAMATIGGCAAFAAASGSSVATSATMASVALPQMRRYKYDAALATGCLAAGGTLGILIPPSLGFILYAVVTEESIGKLFIAGIIPGLLLTAMFVVCIYILSRKDPRLRSDGHRVMLKEKIFSLKGTWATLALFVLVMGGIYAGFFTPTEAGAVGAFGALVIGVVRRRLGWPEFVASLLDTGRITAMIFIILIGAMIFSTFLTVSTIPSKLASVVSELPVPSLLILTAILIFYLILGSLMDIISGILLTLPIFYPLVLNLGFDSIWFGVIMVIMLEMGLITPPVGLNVFVIKGVANDVPIDTIFRGILPFLVAMIVCVGILIAFPQIATFLPGII